MISILLLIVPKSTLRLRNKVFLNKTPKNQLNSFGVPPLSFTLIISLNERKQRFKRRVYQQMNNHRWTLHIEIYHFLDEEFVSLSAK